MRNKFLNKKSRRIDSSDDLNRKQIYLDWNDNTNKKSHFTSSSGSLRNDIIENKMWEMGLRYIGGRSRG